MNTCSKCKLDKPEVDFNFKDKAVGRRETMCRACKKSYKDKHYQANKAAYKARAKNDKAIQRQRNARFVNRVKARLGCVDCDNHDPEVLDFDHITNKVMSICRAVRQPWSLHRLKTEMRKCEIRCSNCHRKITRARSSKAERQAFNPVSV